MQGRKSAWPLLSLVAAGGLLWGAPLFSAEPDCERQYSGTQGEAATAETSALRGATKGFERILQQTRKLQIPVIDQKGYLLTAAGQQAYVRIDAPASPKGPLQTLVLVHGFGQNSSFFDSLTDELIERQGVRVVRVDLSNSGHTLIKNGKKLAPTLEDDAILVRSVIESLGLRDVVLVGHSRGHGVTALVTAAIPDRVAFHVAVNPYVKWLPDYFFSNAIYPQSQLAQDWSQAIDPHGTMGVSNFWQDYFNGLQKDFTKIADFQAFNPDNPLGLHSLLSQVPADVPLDEFNSGVFRQQQIDAAIEVAKGMSPEKGKNLADLTPVYTQPQMLKAKTLFIRGGQDTRFAPSGVTDSIEKIKESSDKLSGAHTIEMATEEDGDHFMPARMADKVVDIMGQAFEGKIFRK